MKEYISIRISTLRIISLALLSLIAAIASVFFIIRYNTVNDVPYIETKAYYELRANGRTALYFRYIDKDTIMRGMALSPVSVNHAPHIKAGNKDLLRMVEINLRAINERMAQLDSIQHELDYYLDRHNVQDEGFDIVAEKIAVMNNERTRLGKWRDALAGIGITTHLYIKRVAQRTRIDSIDLSPVFVGIDGGIWTQGRWLKAERSGKGVSHDHANRIVAGTWNADTMSHGVILDHNGIYRGQTDRWMQAYGHGEYLYRDNTTYEGRFIDDREDGFGVAVSTRHLKAGEWRKGKFKGERMQYTSERIYGIDISKYQHGKGRKYHPIHWAKLRITNLGKTGMKNACGEVNYPVSFVFIKSTEGTTVRNKFFAADYTQAKKHSLPVGAYHFFSTRTPGARQAKFFIRNTRLRKGDLPPVLDLEPTDAQIKAMGGVEALFRNVRQWLRTVQAATGAKPVLYVGQSFVNKYLNHAPDIKRNYNVWIARYGEFKPDVKLIFWQLSPEGRVSGIHGDVDINVFNGYRSQFNDFILQNSIR